MIRYLSLVLILFTIGCHAPVTIVTPEGKIAYTADQIVLQLEKLQDAAITLEANQTLSTDSTRLVIQFVVSSTKTLRESPSGALTTTKIGLRELQKNLSPLESDKLRSILNVITAMLEVY